MSRSDLRPLLARIVEEEVPEDRVALLLSGGVDSVTCGLAAQDVGKQVHAYTFRLGQWDTRDSLAAEKAADLFGFSLTMIDVPYDYQTIKRDFFKLLRQYDCKKKTQVECTWPFLYVYPQITEKYVVSGIAADGHYGISRKACINYKEPKGKFDNFRHDYFDNENPAGLLQQLQLCEEHDKEFIAPYMHPDVFDFFIQYDWYEINKPVEKQLVMENYPSAFKKLGRRRHENLQLVAGIPAFFEQLLDDPDVNTKSRTRLMDLCRDHV